MAEPSILYYRRKEYEVEPAQTLADALKVIDLLPEQVLAVRNGELISANQIIYPGERVEIIAVMAGG